MVIRCQKCCTAFSGPLRPCPACGSVVTTILAGREEIDLPTPPTPPTSPTSPVRTPQLMVAAYMVRVQGRTPAEAANLIRRMSTSDIDTLCSMIKDRPDDPSHHVPADIRDWTESEVLRQMDLGSLVWERQRLYTQLAQLREQVDALTRSIEAALSVAGVKVCGVGEWVVRDQVSMRSTLDPQRLLELGVGADVIRAAEVTKEVHSITIRKFNNNKAV